MPNMCLGLRAADAERLWGVLSGGQAKTVGMKAHSHKNKQQKNNDSHGKIEREEGNKKNKWKIFF
jgi:hypothetical protein